MNDQQWPLVGTADQGDSADRFTNPGEDERYVLFIEQARGSGEYRGWDIQRTGTSYDTREQARAAARATADTFKTEHPMFPQSRAIYQLSPDSYVVAVHGLTSVFHFRITVGERI